MKNIYIDMANMAAEYKNKNIEIDFSRLFIFLKNKYKSDNIYIFTGYMEKYKYLYDQNISIGFNYIFKDAVFNKDENKIKANCDVDIAINGTIDTVEKNLSEAILISSDGDFASLVKFWKDRGVQVKILSPVDPNRCSYLLKKDNNSVSYMFQILSKIVKESD
jgi:uncharacterized LabA/DUF88 family protein